MTNVELVSAVKSHRLFQVDEANQVGVHFQPEFRTCTVTFRNLNDPYTEQSHFFYTADYPTGDWSPGRLKAFKWMRFVHTEVAVDKEWSELEGQKRRIENQIAKLERELSDLQEKQVDIFKKAPAPADLDSSDVVFDERSAEVENDEGYWLTEELLDFAKKNTQKVSKSLGKTQLMISQPISDGSTPISADYCAYVKGERGQWIAVRALETPYVKWLLQKLIPVPANPHTTYVKTSYTGYPESVEAEIMLNITNRQIVLTIK